MPFSTIFAVLLMILGFGLVIAVHELGHFLAAKWAGVRIHTFAIGFGSAIFTYRQGLGLRWGSSEPEYNRLLSSQALKLAAGESPWRPSSSPQASRRGDPQAFPSPTEYRLNWFPFGGYVKMLGQEDLSPTTSTAPDSFAAKPVWQRMIIISAGVVMNLILAAVLFIAAYTHGVREIAPIIGIVTPGSPAGKAGMLPGDRVISIGSEPVESFSDVLLAVAMSAKSTPLPIAVLRGDTPEQIILTPTPETGAMGLLQVGAGPAYGTAIALEKDFETKDDFDQYRRDLDNAGLGAIAPGMRLTSIAGGPLVANPDGAGAFAAISLPLERALSAAAGAPIDATFTDPETQRTETVSLAAKPELQITLTKIEGKDGSFAHLLGLTPVMAVAGTTPRAAKSGLLPGDVFARLGAIDWPSIPAGIAHIRANKGKTIDLTVLRNGKLVSLAAPVDIAGTVGFNVADTHAMNTLLAAFPADFAVSDAASSQALKPASPQAPSTQASSPQAPSPTAAARQHPAKLPRSLIIAANDIPVANFLDLAAALRAATRRGEPANIALSLERPSHGDAPAANETVTLALTPADTEALHALGWDASHIVALFDTATFEDRATGPLDAISKGAHKTYKTIAMTYLTFLRLFQGTVPVDQLQGPVGITHIGARLVQQGFIYLIFYLGLISANLAVINFLPLPITDGGQMVFLAIEGVTKKPVSPAIQNAAIIAGLVLIGAVFIVVTFNDVVRLFG